MPSDQTPPAGKRDDAATRMRDAYLSTGKVPLGTAVRLGLVSLLRDPWLMVLRQLPGPIGFVLRRSYYRRRLGSMGRGVLIDPGVDLLDPANVYLDDFCYLGKPSQLVAPEGYIRIGKRCHVMARILGHGGVEIGDYVAANGIILSATDSHQGGYRMAGPMLPPEQRNLRYGKVVIEDDAFLGNFSLVMPGVTVGQGAVVGPHSLVVADVKPWTVVMGNPARPIGERDPVKLPRPD